MSACTAETTRDFIEQFNSGRVNLDLLLTSEVWDQKLKRNSKRSILILSKISWINLLLSYKSEKNTKTAVPRYSFQYLQLTQLYKNKKILAHICSYFYPYNTWVYPPRLYQQ